MALVDTVDTAAMDTEASMEDTTASVRPRLIPTLDMVDTVLVDTAATAMEDSTGDTMASVRLRPNPRLLPSLTLDTEDTEDTEDIVAMVDTATAGASMANVRLRLSPTSDMEVMEDTVLVAMEDTVVTVTAMASKIILCRRNH